MRDRQGSGEAEIIVEDHDHYQVVVAVSDGAEVASAAGACSPDSLDLYALPIMCLDVPTLLAERTPAASVVFVHDRFGDVTDRIVVRPYHITCSDPGPQSEQFGVDNDDNSTGTVD